MSITIRRVRLAEWREVRELRLRALADPQAAVAFLDAPVPAADQPDSFWQERAAGAALGEDVAQFVAVDERGRWTATATVLTQRAGTPDEFDEPRPADRAIVVGVFVDPDHRGRGLIEALFDACSAQARAVGRTEIFLDVHEDNARAIAAYRRCGFRPSGVRFVDMIGPEIEMVRAL